MGGGVVQTLNQCPMLSPSKVDLQPRLFNILSDYVFIIIKLKIKDLLQYNLLLNFLPFE